VIIELVWTFTFVLFIIADMTHDTAVRTIVSLVPEIEKKSAETVLLDYAEAENLPPAQLEKLAQVFNTLRTVDHIDKSASADDRGKSVDLVNVPVLVAGYIIRTKQEKSAASLKSSTSSHDVSRVDLMSAVRFDAPTISKAAAAPQAEVRRYSSEEVENIFLDLKVDARLSMEKLAGELLGKLPRHADGRLDMQAACSDARAHCNTDMLRQSLDWLKSASVAPLTGIAMDAPLVKRAFAITGECGKLLTSFNEEFVTYKLMSKLANSVEPKKEMTEDEINQLVESMEDPDEAAAALEDYIRAQGGDPADYDPGEAQDVEVPSYVKSNVPSESTPRADATTTTKDTTATTPAAKGRISKVLNAIGAPVREAGKTVSDATSYAQNQLDRIVSKDRANKDQMRSDMDVEDVRRAIGLRRMIGTDPVLRESDPRDVLEIYNAISRTNPEIVHNMPALRLLLREAVSYEGLTLDSQKQLTDIRANASKSENQEADNLKRRYTTSGVSDVKAKSR
jgi:hypothetical protein